MGSSESRPEPQTTEEDRTITNQRFINLKCTTCNKYLSIPPILTSSDGRMKKCGREPCNSQSPKRITTGNLSRDVLYEELAKHQKFPCGVSEKCSKEIPWIKVLDHESICPYRKITCPKTNCHQQYELQQVEEHFKKLHKNHLIQEGKSFFYNEWKHPHFQEIFLFKSKEIQVFIYTRLEPRNSVNMKFNAFAISSLKESTKFTMKFDNSGTGNVTMKYPIILFPNTLPCTRGELNDIPLQTINTSHLNEMLGSSYTLTVTLDNDENPNQSCDLAIGDVSGSIPAILSCFNCPICFELMDSEIVLCTKGHSICKKCQIQIEQTNKCCPLCKSPFGECLRNYKLEELASKLSSLKLAKR